MAESYEAHIVGNIAFNGPRAGEIDVGWRSCPCICACACIQGHGFAVASPVCSSGWNPPSPNVYSSAYVYLCTDNARFRLLAGINFNDGLGGGSVIEENVLFNFCRESSDHGVFNR